MELSVKGAAFVRAHEGFVPRWYKDPIGVLTIGVGFTWRSKSFRTWWKNNKPGIPNGRGTMTRSEADDALRYLCKNEYGRAVNKFLGKSVPQHVYDGTVSPVYNLGPGSLKWRWAAAVKAGNYSAAAALLRKTGVTAAGRRLAGLVRRRKEEAHLIEHGEYTGVGSVKESKPVDAMEDGVLVRGERGEDVAKLILSLTKLGFYTGIKDDVFGYGTEAAVMAFQNAHGLKADGFAGPKTLAAIEDAISNPRKIVIPEKAREVVEDAAKDMGRSKTVWGAIVSWMVTAGAAITQMHPALAAVLILVVSLCIGVIVYERWRKAKGGKDVLEIIEGLAGKLM